MESRRTRPATTKSSPYICSYNLRDLLIHQKDDYSAQCGERTPSSIRARLKDGFADCHHLPLLLTFIVPRSFVDFIADRDQLLVLRFSLLHFIINAPHHESWGHVATACPYVLHVILLQTSNHITRHAFDSLPCSTDSSIVSRLPRPSELFLFQVPTLLTQSGHMHKPSEIAGHWNSIKEKPRQSVEHRVTRHTSSYIRLPHYPSFLFMVIQNKFSKSIFLHRTVTIYNNGG